LTLTGGHVIIRASAAGRSTSSALCESFADPGGTGELTLERWIPGDVDVVHLPALPLGVLERHRDGEQTLVLVIGRV
jgi:hypothetical protein